MPENFSATFTQPVIRVSFTQPTLRANFPGGFSQVVNNIAAVLPLVFNPATGEMSIPPADGLTDGYLTKEDWQTFNDKADAADIAVVQADVDAHEARIDNPHNVTKTQVGLGNVDNTADADKPISSAAQTALNAKADLVLGKVPTSQIPVDSTDDVPEGSTNLYHTEGRVRSTVLTGLVSTAAAILSTDTILQAFGKVKYLIDTINTQVRSTTLDGLSLASGVAITASDTVLSAFGKLQKQITDNVTAIAANTASIALKRNIADEQYGLISTNFSNSTNSYVNISKDGINDLVFNVEANKTYFVEAYLSVISFTTSGQYYTILFPSSTTLRIQGSGSTTDQLQRAHFSIVASGADIGPFQTTNNSALDGYVELHGSFTTTQAGTITFQLKSTSASTSRIVSGSYVKVTKTN